MKPVKFLATLIALAALGLMVVKLNKLMDIGTCSSGGPYVSARECPAGTGTQILLLTGSIFVYVIAMMASGQGLFLFGLLFCALSVVFIQQGATDSSFGATGYGVGGMFALMGVIPVFMAVRGWFDRPDPNRPRMIPDLSNLSAMAVTNAAMMPQRPAFVPAPATPPANGASDPLDRLRELGELHQRGVLTDAEFQAQKAKILGSS